jgi:PAS domain S-box-containing protein
LIVIGGAIAVSALIVLRLLLRRRLLERLVELAMVVRRFEAGQTVPVPARTRTDEIGELARALDAWLESEARSAIFDKAVIGVARLDLEGRVLESNPALRRILGYDESELRGRVLDDFMEPADAQRRVFASLQERTDASVQLELKYVRRDGSPIWDRLAGPRFVAAGAVHPSHDRRCDRAKGTADGPGAPGAPRQSDRLA